jgi:hypothetical protein
MTQIVNKTLLMQHIIAGGGHECFEHSIDGWFDVTLMRAWAKHNVAPIQITLEQIVPHVKASRVWEEQRVLDLTEREARTDPALLVEYIRDGSAVHTYIDGTHRAIKLERLGATHQLCYIVPEAAIIRPDFAQMGPAKDVHGMDWGDDFIDGAIVRRIALRPQGRNPLLGFIDPEGGGNADQ